MRNGQRVDDTANSATHKLHDVALAVRGRKALEQRPGLLCPREADRSAPDGLAGPGVRLVRPGGALGRLELGHLALTRRQRRVAVEVGKVGEIRGVREVILGGGEDGGGEARVAELLDERRAAAEDVVSDAWDNESGSDRSDLAA